MKKANGRKQLRTKFTQNQKESMSEFAQSIGWKLQKQDEGNINEFCTKIGVQKWVFKVWLHNNKKKKNSTVDILPECLIQKILCCLSFKEATKMSIVSKTWLQASLTLPKLKFEVDYPNGNMKIVDRIMERYRNRKIPIEKFELSHYKSRYSSEVFPLFYKWLDVTLQNGIKDLVFGVTNFSLPIYTILAAKSLRKLVLMDCDLLHVSLSGGVANCLSLRELSLIRVRLDEKMLQTLLNSCSLIVSFILEYCSGLEKIELLNLQKIKSVSIKTRKNQLLKIQAQTLIHLSYTSDSLAKLDVVECQNLKSLDLYVGVWTSDRFSHKGVLHDLISRSQSLKVLNIQYCGGIEEIEAPKDLLLDHRGSIPQVDVLNVTILCLDEECPALLDALLWSCHPKRLNLRSSSTRIFTFFMNHLMYIKNSSHSSSQRTKPWYRQLKEVKAFDWKNQPLELVSGELAISSLTERKFVCFLLDWQCS